MASTDIVLHPAIEKIAADLAQIEEKVLTNYTLADAIREGAKHTEQNVGGWLEGDYACALAAGYLAAKARKRV